MNYDEACCETVTRETAKREIDKHDCDGWEAFVADCGDDTHYPGKAVLDWLGY